ncbi:hypothetical protein D1007_28701 [Hordeum vulgare]|nr:hypothetical protein D1007_28701 [Hordeum vulgare]
MASISFAIDRCEDWVVPRSDSNLIPQKINKQTAYRLAVRMETSVMGLNEPSKGFWYPLVVETSYTFKDLLGAMCMKYAWSEGDSVQEKYWEMLDEQFVPLQNDEQIGYTHSEEEEEKDGMLIEEEYEGRDMLEIEWDRDNPNVNAGAVYKNMDELWNALTMYYIQSNNVYGTQKNEKRKLTVHCPDPRSSWKLDATSMCRKKTIQIRYNSNPHTCAPMVETHKSKLAR